MASSILSKRPDLYHSVADWNSYSKPNESRKARSRALLAAPKLGCSLLNGSGTDGQRLAEMRPPASPCWARCRAPCAARPCRRRSRTAASARRSAAGRPGAPWWCARPRRRCRYAAGPTGRSRSRTARSPWPAPCRRCGRPACGLLQTATRARPRRGNDRSATWIGPKLGAAAICVNAGRRPKVPRAQ